MTDTLTIIRDLTHYRFTVPFGVAWILGLWCALGLAVMCIEAASLLTSARDTVRGWFTKPPRTCPRCGKPLPTLLSADISECCANAVYAEGA